MKSRVPASLSVFTGALLALFAGEARAACGEGPDCAMGFVCSEVGASTCDIGCIPGADCTPSTCESTPIFGCTPAPCASNADCAADMVCAPHTEATCTSWADPSPPPCEPGTECDTVPVAPPEEPECTEETVLLCTPRYLLPCTASSDCGDGFDCVPEEQCSCGGSEGVSPPEAGNPEPPPECGCTQGPNNYCKLREMPCAMNADCPTGWLCKDVGGSTECGGSIDFPGAPPMSGDDPGSNDDPSGAAPEPEAPSFVAPPPEECTTVPGRLLCIPPYADLGGGSLGGKDSSGGFDGETGSSSDPGAPTVGSGNGEENGADDDGESPKGESSSGDDGSCQMSSGRAGSTNASLLALFGLAALARRRRERGV